ncbi:hypothetical protein AMATHDRAFT_159506, partial [Amanita thiersii Skay4041]
SPCVFFKGFSKNKDVVHVDAHPPFCNFIPEDVIHHCLESREQTNYNNKHNEWFEESPVGPKCGLPFVSLLDPNTVLL